MHTQTFVCPDEDTAITAVRITDAAVVRVGGVSLIVRDQATAAKLATAAARAHALLAGGDE